MEGEEEIGREGRKHVHTHTHTLTHTHTHTNASSSMFSTSLTQSLTNHTHIHTTTHTHTHTGASSSLSDNSLAGDEALVNASDEPLPQRWVDEGEDM
jgi:hypothetical protein